MFEKFGKKKKDVRAFCIRNTKDLLSCQVAAQYLNSPNFGQQSFCRLILERTGVKEYHIRFLLFDKMFDLVRRLLVSPPTVVRVQSIIVLITAISAAEEKSDLFFHTKLCRRAILLSGM